MGDRELTPERGFTLPDDTALGSPCLARMFRDLARRTLVMAILNVTPDSFSDGGRFSSPEEAAQAGARMAADGADIIDVGGESTRPGSDTVPEMEEIRRVVPVIEALAQVVDVPISVDTSRSAVADRALDAGASIINDVTGLVRDPELASVAAARRAPLVIMHMKGTPRNMQHSPRYEDLVAEISSFLEAQIAVAESRGLPREFTIVDPGFGFGKTPAHNLEMLRRLGEFAAVGRPLLIGTSRKSTLGAVLGGAGVTERLEATAATVAIAIANGASIVRVHDVPEMVRVARTADAVMSAGL